MASRSTPVSTPISWQRKTRSSVVTLPAAPLWAAKGQPPMPATALSKYSMPISSAATTLAMGRAGGSWGWGLEGARGPRLVVGGVAPPLGGGGPAPPARGAAGRRLALHLLEHAHHRAGLHVAL